MRQILSFQSKNSRVVEWKRNRQRWYFRTPGSRRPGNGQRLTLLGNGIGFLPNILCSEEAKQGKIVRVLPQWRGEPAPLFFIYPAQRFVSPRVRAFIDLAEKCLRTDSRKAETIKAVTTTSWRATIAQGQIFTTTRR
jgi:DNA-binding transcriptional LysR family regulator